MLLGAARCAPTISVLFRKRMDFVQGRPAGRPYANLYLRVTKDHHVIGAPIRVSQKGHQNERSMLGPYKASKGGQN
jgi:hypothetical protein